jgi:hypothetical protein
LTLIALLSACSTNSRAAGADPFSIEASLLEALEGGPVLVEVTLKYAGDKPLTLREWAMRSEESYAMKVPQSWRDRVLPCLWVGPEYSSRQLRPGDRLTQTAYLHHAYSNIAAGRVAIDITWDIGVPAPDDKISVIASPSTRLLIDVLPSSEKNVASVKNRLTSKLTRGGLSKAEKRQLGKSILYTTHRQFIPLAIRMIESRDEDFPRHSLLDFLCEFPADSEGICSRLVQFVLDPATELDGDIFERWRARKTPLAPDQLKRLMDAEDVWTRVLTYIVFGKRCDDTWTAALLVELREHDRPLDWSRFAHLLAALDHDAFEVREKASRALARLGERVVPQLRDSLHATLSLEARQRVLAALAEIKEFPLPKNRSWVIQYARNVNSRESRRVLEALAAGSPTAWLTKEARQALHDISDRTDSQRGH